MDGCVSDKTLQGLGGFDIFQTDGLTPYNGEWEMEYYVHIYST